MSLFSIIIPSYNRPDLLSRLLASISRQTLRDFEVFVVDDASIDRESYERVVTHFSRDFPVNYLRNDENRGAQYSRNRGVMESKGRLIAFVDDDDEWLPSKLERQAELFASAPEHLGLVYAWADAIGENGFVSHKYRAVQQGEALAALLYECFIPSPTVVVRREAIEKMGGFDESLPSCQDWDMWTRIAAAEYDIDVAQDVLSLHHKHEGVSIGKSPQSIDGFRQFYAKHTILYKRMGMARDLSEKYRGLAHQANLVGNRELVGHSLRCSIALWRGNWKAWVRYVQFLIGGMKC